MSSVRHARPGTRTKRGAELLVALATAVASASCASTLTEGQLGTPRFIGTLRGAPPMDVLPPVSDRAGNLYILAGAREAPDVAVFVGRAGGGFTTGCKLTKGDRLGPLGWVGFGQDRQWYWSGGALVAVTSNGDCRRVLDRDPLSGSDLTFTAVFPWVADRSSRSTVVAMIKTPSDPSPFTAIVDLDSNAYATLRPFEPGSAREVVIHGVGASAKKRTEFMVTSFTEGDALRTEGRFFDEEGGLTARVAIPNPGALTAYGIRGFLQGNAGGLVAGVTNEKKLVLFDRSSARVTDVPGMDPVGVHVWDDALYVVGISSGRPTIAPILDSGTVGDVTLWDASAGLVAKLAGPLDVTDDRAPPRRTIRFDAPRNAVGPFPLVTEHSSHRYARDTTLVLVAGASFGTGASAFTQLAVAPAGVSYP